jgi:prepilin-type N-terminal cleavage/methylation domain-containing protein
MRRNGFTLVEVTVALVILAVGILGISSSAGRLGQVSSTAEAEAIALQAVQDRIAMVMLHPSYAKLDSIFSKTESNVPSSGYTRVTDVTRTLTTGAGGKTVDRSSIQVTVTGPGLLSPVSRTQVVGAP